MESQFASSGEVTVQQVRQEIEAWRHTRSKLGPMPEPLWDKTVKAARRFGVHRTARALGLHYTKVKQRVQPMASGEADGTKQRKARTKASGKPFIEVSSIPWPAPPSSDGVVVEVVMPKGARLSIRLSSASCVDIASLVHGFTEGQACCR